MRIPVLDRKFYVFLAVVVVAAVVGFWVVPAKPAVTAVKYLSYWTILVTFGLFSWNLWKLRTRLALPIEGRRDWAWIVLCTVLLLVHESYGFKILMDEVLLSGSAMSLHFDRIFMVPLRGHDLQGAYLLIDGYVDKRPIFFPFLLSLVHDFTGYRVENAFALNSALTFLYLALGYLTGRAVHGRHAGLVFVFLQTGLPLLAQNSTGGGFELLNLCMILSTLLLGIAWVRTSDKIFLSAFLLSFILLAQTRYESALFILPVAFLVLWVWFREGRVILSFEAILAPLLLIIYPWQNKVFVLSSSAWELAGNPGHETVFSLKYIPENLIHALNFFFDYTRLQSNSVLLSAVGMISLPFLVLGTWRKFRKPGSLDPVTLSVGAFTLTLAMSFMLLMAYFWGQFDDPVIRRLSLPTYLLFTLSIVAVLPEFIKSTRVWNTVVGLSVASLLLYSVPVMAGHAYTDDYLAGRETEWRQEFMRSHPARDYLMVDNDSILWIINQISSTPIGQAKARKDSLVFHLRNHSWTDIFVFQRLVIDPDTGLEKIRTEDELGPEFRLETVVERRLKMLTLSRISRVVSIGVGGSSEPATPTHGPVPENSEKIKQAYWENWLKNLP